VKAAPGKWGRIHAANARLRKFALFYSGAGGLVREAKLGPDHFSRAAQKGQGRAMEWSALFSLLNRLEKVMGVFQ
jgi:hypothetical protein